MVKEEKSGCAIMYIIIIYMTLMHLLLLYYFHELRLRNIYIREIVACIKPF